MKAKRISLAILLCLLTVAMAVLTSFAIFAEEDEPSVSIDRFNLSFNENIYIKYAVSFNGVDVTKLETQNRGMLFWTSPQESYTKENAESVTNELFYDSAISSYLYAYTKLAAKQMTDVIYARAYVVVDGETYYSEVEEYSILRYAYNKLGKSIGSTVSTNEGLKTLLVSMLDYGAAAQSYFNYKTDRPANADFVDVNVEGGVIAETGMTSGLYLAGDEITLSAPESKDDGTVFEKWVDSASKTVATEANAQITVGAQNEIYTAIYVKKVSEGLKYTLKSDDTYEVSGIGSCTGTDIVIPSTYEGKAVTSIGSYAFEGCTSLNSVTIGNGVTSIGEYAFYNCTSLASIEIPDSVTSIGYYAFRGCTSLESITIPFVGASKNGTSNTHFGYIFGASSYSDKSAYVPSSLKTVIITGGSSIGNDAFRGCTSLTSIEIPDSVTSIGEDAFWNCTSLASIEIPDSVTSIGDWAFYDCTSLASIKYGSTEAQWQAITKGTYWNSNTGSYTITYNYIGK